MEKKKEKNELLQVFKWVIGAILLLLFIVFLYGVIIGIFEGRQEGAFGN